MGCLCIKPSSSIDPSRGSSKNSMFDELSHDLKSIGHRSTKTISKFSGEDLEISNSSNAGNVANLNSNSISLSDFQILEVIGKGKHSKIFLVNK